MKTIYIDPEHKCHASDNGTMTAVETEYFDGKCDAWIEGYCMEVDSYGNVQKLYPWKDVRILEAYQEQYERMGGGSSVDVIEKSEAYDILIGVRE